MYTGKNAVLIGVLVWSAALILALVPGGSAGAMEPEERMLVVFDFGDGGTLHHWVPVSEAGDAMEATLEAGEALEIEVNYTVSEYGAFVNSIDGVEPTGDFSMFWNLLVWNVSGGNWEASDVGASSLTLPGPAAVCWYYGGWGNVSDLDASAVEPPVPVEDEKDPTGDDGEVEEDPEPIPEETPLPTLLPAAALMAALALGGKKRR